MSEISNADAPERAVMAWWQAMQDKDHSKLAELMLPDYISSGGPSGRTVGRDDLLTEAAAFFGGAQIDTWSVTDLEVRRHGDTAICAYNWYERGSFGDAPFELSGLATDVLVMGKPGWQHQAHHVSLMSHEPSASNQ